MAPSSPKVSGPSSASTRPRSQTSSATPRSPPDWRSTAPGTVKIPEPIVVPTTMSTRSRSVRTRASSREAGGADTSELRRDGGGDVAGSGRPAEIRGPYSGGERRPYRPLEVAGRPGSAQLLEHQRTGEHGRHRIGDPLAREWRCRAVHRLEQPRSPPARMKIGAGGDPQPADERGAQVGQDVAIQVVGYDDLEALRLAHQLHRQGVHVAVLGLDPAELGGDPFERLLPDPVSGHCIRLVAHRNAGLAVILRPLEGGADDALHALRGVDFFGDEFIAAHAPPAEINPFGVLAKDHEVDTPAVAPQGGEVGMEQRHRTKVDVQIEAEPESQQDVPCVLVARYARVSDRAQQDGVHVVAQMVERRVWERFPGLEVVIGAVWQTLELEGDAVLPGGPFDGAEGRIDDFGPDPVAGDHGDSAPSHSKPVARPQLTQ